MAAPVTIHTTFSIEFFPDKIDQLTNTPGSPVGIKVREAADEVLTRAKENVGTRYSGTTGKVTDNRSGRLRDSGKVENIGGSSFAVVFDHPIAFLHHEGKQSSYQIPKGRGGYILSNPFDNTRSSGGKFRARGPVTWRGSTTGNPYLRNAATEVGLRQSGTLLRGNRPTKLFRLRPL